MKTFMLFDSCDILAEPPPLCHNLIFLVKLPPPYASDILLEWPLAAPFDKIGRISKSHKGLT